MMAAEAGRQAEQDRLRLQGLDRIILRDDTRPQKSGDDNNHFR